MTLLPNTLRITERAVKLAKRTSNSAVENTMRVRALSFAVAVLVGIAACGGSDDNDESDGGTTNPTGQNFPSGTFNATGTFTAQINGATWTATTPVTVSRQSGNIISIIGTGSAGTTPYAVSLNVGTVNGPGTYSFVNTAGTGSQ